MKLQFILAIGSATIAILGLSIYTYLRLEFAKQRIRQRERATDILSAPKFMALTPDHQLSLRGYLIKKMDAADRKRILFSTLSNTALAIGGTAPILAMLTADPIAQKILNAISSVSVLCLGIFSLEKFAIEHRRSGYLLDSLIQEWLSEVGDFSDLSDVEGFRLLIRKTKEVLDTGETSFIGAGSKQAAIDPKSPKSPINHQSITNQLPTITPLTLEQTTASPVTPSPVAPQIAGIPLDELLADDIDWTDAVTQGGTTAVSPSDFAKWQADALKGEN